jgi:hypothetical protein
MSTSWYIARNKQKFGPFSTLQLRQLAVLGLVQRNEYVLPERSTRWVPASTALDAVQSAEAPKQYWLSVGGKARGPYLREHIQAMLLRREVSGATRACSKGAARWSTLSQLAEFQDFISQGGRDSRAQLGAGSTPSPFSPEEAAIHLAGKDGDRLARLISTLFDLRRRYAGNQSLAALIEQNIHNLKAMRERLHPEGVA